MTLTPMATSINGRGKPILIVESAGANWTSFGSLTFTPTGVTEAMGATVNITSSATNDRLLTATHSFLLGQKVRVAGHSGSTPSINGDWEVTEVSDSTHIKIGVDITAGGTGGTVRRIPDMSNVKVGMRALATKTASPAPARTVWGKITAIDAANWIVTVDKWRQGTTEVTPDSATFSVNGEVIELPYCYELVESFEPDVLIHPLFRTSNLPNRVRTKFFGWKYVAVLDYARHIHADVLISMRPALNLKENDNLVLIPRADKPQHQYNVYHGDTVQLARFGRAPGHKKTVFTFKGKETIPSWPIPESGYGYGYAAHYGTEL